jgi:hypothetical protein
VDDAVFTDRFAAPLDSARRVALSFAQRAPTLWPWLASRDRRVALLLSAHACVAFTLAVLFPAPLFVLLPLVLGVPHVVSDLRYLVLRRISSRGARRVVFGVAALFVAMIAANLSGVRFDVARAELCLGIASVTGAVIATARPRARPALVLTVVVGLSVAALRAPLFALLVLLHVHNVVALVLWLLLFRKRARAVIAPLLLVGGLSALLASGALLRVTFGHGVYRAFGAHLLAATDVLAPGLPDRFAIGLVCAWIFLQSVHYLVWLVLVPTDAELGSGATSFRQSLRSLAQDLGPVGLALFAASFVAFAGLGGVAPLATRNAYLALASFHAWLELAGLAYCAAGGAPKIA